MGKLEKAKKLAQNQSKADTNYFVSIYDAQSNTISTTEWEVEDWEMIKNEPDIQSLTSYEISEKLAELNNGEQSSVQDHLILSATSVSLVQKYLNEIDKEFQKLIVEQKHKTFVVIIDRNNKDVDRKSFVFASNPVNTYDKASEFGKGIASMYVEINT